MDTTLEDTKKAARKAENKKYYQKNIKKIKEYNKFVRKKNPEKTKEYNRIYRETNKDRLTKYDKNRWDSRCQSVSAQKNKKYNTDPLYKLSISVRNRLNRALKTRSIKKLINTLDIIGCSIEFLKNYLEYKFKDGMTWDNHGIKGWHIDHIKPMSSFDLSDPEQLKECCHYTNLQPLWWWENISKSDKIVETIVLYK